MTFMAWTLLTSAYSTVNTIASPCQMNMGLLWILPEMRELLWTG